MQQKPYILWLPSWYPNKITPYVGDFVQRHAQAAARFSNIIVLVLVHDVAGVVTKRVKVDETAANNLTEITVYYHINASLPKVVRSAGSFLFRAFLYRKIIKDIFKKRGLPQMAHVHVAGNGGLAALWLHRKYGLPFLISEHWGGYLNEGGFGFNRLSFTKCRLIREIYRKAHSVSAVSLSLAKNLKAVFGNLDLRIIANVVDTELFKPSSATKSNKLQFIHISTLDHPKNPEAILEGFGLFFKKSGIDFTLVIVGPDSAEVKDWCRQFGIEDKVKLEKERPQSQLVPLIQQSDALVLFSLHETFGCVIIEANACGVPVLVSNVPVFKELVQEGFNGLMANGTTAAHLCSLLKTFMQQKEIFSKEAISRHTANKFDYHNAGMLFRDWYTAVEQSLAGKHK